MQYAAAKDYLTPVPQHRPPPTRAEYDALEARVKELEAFVAMLKEPAQAAPVVELKSKKR